MAKGNVDEEDLSEARFHETSAAVVGNGFAQLVYGFFRNLIKKMTVLESPLPKRWRAFRLKAVASPLPVEVTKPWP
ncbi:hypothetical protein, partial [Mesorhizobium sp. M7A.F.Ca.MR.148.00.0.0]|uniref:hypothetical protein n=1 Tax=Mesorhizobium sp. M7A.F.Ca.MR.148.00.0.0 TaxID=2496775 RepID=UPI0019D2041C